MSIGWNAPYAHAAQNTIPLHLHHTIQELYAQIEAHTNLRAYKKNFEHYLKTIGETQGVDLPRFLTHLSHLHDLSILEHLSLSWLKQSPVYLQILLKNTPTVPLPQVSQYTKEMTRKHTQSRQILRELLHRLEKLTAQYDERLLRHNDMRMQADIYSISSEHFDQLVRLLAQRTYAHTISFAMFPTPIPSTLTVHDQEKFLHLLTAPIDGDILLIAEIPNRNKSIVFASHQGILVFKNVQYALCSTGQQVAQGEPLGVAVEATQPTTNPLTLEFYTQGGDENAGSEFLISRMFRVQEQENT